MQRKNMLQQSCLLLNFIVSVATAHDGDKHECPLSLEMPKSKIHILLGSTRDGRTSDKLANALKKIADTRDDVETEILDLRDYSLPFLQDSAIPASREVITDPVLKRWSDTIQQATAFIFVVPEYNGSYPGVLKNALDIIYKEWNHKPVGFVGYSGGASGGASAIEHLRRVVKVLQMHAMQTQITIPKAWNAFDDEGNLINKEIEQNLIKLIDEILAQKVLNQ